ncbi:MAG: hypothetical protein PHP44_06000 [Kiritimatiellae bacterium]|nr:hypothetical protein [Kiritimatiellia bacterium]MDD4735641.1 hypothetical protein [Kiritimatiellia bacterium]
MEDYGQVDKGHSFGLHSLLQLIRAAGAILGIITVIIGLFYAMRLLGLVFTALSNPESYQAFLEVWISAVGGEELDVVISGSTYPVARFVVFAILGGGCILLGWLSLGMILVGAKIVSWTVSDQEAVKRLLTHAFGSEKKARSGAPH